MFSLEVRNSDQFIDIMASWTQNPKYNNLFINVPNECEMCFIAEENFVWKIAVHRLLFKLTFHLSATLWMVSWLQLLRELDFTWM